MPEIDPSPVHYQAAGLYPVLYRRRQDRWEARTHGFTQRGYGATQKAAAAHLQWELACELARRSQNHKADK